MSAMSATGPTGAAGAGAPPGATAAGGPRAQGGRWRRRALRGAQYALAALPLAWVLGRMNLQQFGRAAGAAAWWVLPLAVLAQYGGMFLQAVRWWLTLRLLAPQASLRVSLAQHFLANTYAALIPGALAPDLLRSVLAARRVDAEISWGAAWVMRLAGLVAWVVLAAAGLALTSTALPRRALAPAASALVVLLLLSMLSFSKRATRPCRRLLALLLPAGLLRWGERIREAVYRYRRHRLALAGLVLLALGVELALIFLSALAIYGICGAWRFALLLAYLPAIEVLVVALPLTPGGLGVREALLAAAFARMGLTAEQTGVYVALGLLGLPLRALGGLPFLLADALRARRGSGRRP